MLGRALDVGATGLASRLSKEAADKKKRGQAFYCIWKAINGTTAFTKGVTPSVVTTADMWQLEGAGPSDVIIINGATGTKPPGFVTSKANGKKKPDGSPVMVPTNYEVDKNDNGILNGYEVTGHLHMQDNP